MERLKVTELKALSKSLGLKGYLRLNKADLVRLIMDHLNSRPGPVPRPRQSKDPSKDVKRWRPPKPMRAPPTTQTDTTKTTTQTHLPTQTPTTPTTKIPT